MMSEKQPSRLTTLLSRSYQSIQLEWNDELSALRVRTCVKPIQCYSLAAMGELQQLLLDIDQSPGLLKQFVMTSDVPGVFNFGGDLSLFVMLIRARDVESLRMYARRCVDLVWWMENAANLGIHTTVLVQGDTLGGGLESVMPFHKIIFERSAQAGFPEVLFNMFPGMGAWGFTVRKAGFPIANEMILSGRLYTAEQLQRRRLVDLVVDDGEGEAALQASLQGVTQRLRGTLAALQARQLAAPITYASLMETIDQWTDTALKLTERDLRLMERLAKAQARKVGYAEVDDVHNIRAHELDTAWGEEKTGVTDWVAM
jgi:DSF synthase